MNYDNLEQELKESFIRKENAKLALELALGKHDPHKQLLDSLEYLNSLALDTEKK